jgi:hypothetical protein
VVEGYLLFGFHYLQGLKDTVSDLEIDLVFLILDAKIVYETASRLQKFKCEEILMNWKLLLVIAGLTLTTSLTACSKKDDAAAPDAKAPETSAPAGETKPAEGAKDAAGKAADSVKDAAGKAAEGAKDAAGKAADGTKDAAGKAADSVKDAAGKAADAAKDGAAKTGDAMKAPAGGAKPADAPKKP